MITITYSTYSKDKHLHLQSIYIFWHCRATDLHLFLSCYHLCKQFWFVNWFFYLGACLYMFGKTKRMVSLSHRKHKMEELRVWRWCTKVSEWKPHWVYWVNDLLLKRDLLLDTSTVLSYSFAMQILASMGNETWNIYFACHGSTVWKTDLSLKGVLFSHR